MADFKRVLATAKTCGIPLSEKKLVKPCTELEYLGFSISTKTMDIAIPQEKRLRYLRDLEQWNGKKSELESILGKLMHVCQVLIQGKPFLRRIIDKLGTVKAKSHRVNLNNEEKEDLEWWKLTLASWTGKSLMTWREWKRPGNFRLSSDASGSLGFGVVFDNE